MDDNTILDYLRILKKYEENTDIYFHNNKPNIKKITERVSFGNIFENTHLKWDEQVIKTKDGYIWNVPKLYSLYPNIKIDWTYVTKNSPTYNIISHPYLPWDTNILKNKYDHTYELYYLFPNIDWDWDEITLRARPIDIIKNPTLPWVTKIIVNKSNVDMNLINKYPDLDWDWDYLTNVIDLYQINLFKTKPWKKKLFDVIDFCLYPYLKIWNYTEIQKLDPKQIINGDYSNKQKSITVCVIYFSRIYNVDIINQLLKFII